MYFLAKQFEIQHIKLFRWNIGRLHGGSRCFLYGFGLRYLRLRFQEREFRRFVFFDFRQCLRLWFRITHLGLHFHECFHIRLHCLRKLFVYAVRKTVELLLALVQKSIEFILEILCLSQHGNAQQQNTEDPLSFHIQFDVCHAT